jgi:2-phospho-L-lactate guanylyltransferase
LTLWAVVPVKPLRQAKSRLAAVLTEAERVELSLWMLSRTLEVLAEVREISATLVVSADPDVLGLASAAGGVALPESDPPNLNRALLLAREAARTAGASAVLVLSADLPRLAPSDVLAMAGLAARPPTLVIAPDRHGRGTNALLVAPAALIEFEFGVDSLARHVARAQAVGARVEICDLPALALDLDSPEDLELVRRGEPLLAPKE